MVLLEGITLCSGCEKSVCLPFLRSHFRRTRLSLARLLLTSSCLLHMTRRIYLLTHLFWEGLRPVCSLVFRVRFARVSCPWLRFGVWEHTRLVAAGDAAAAADAQQPLWL